MRSMSTSALARRKSLQDRHRQLHRETRRHLHAQRALRRRALVADVIERILQPVEGFDHRRQQVLSGLGEGEGVRPALEQLHADQALERDDVARQRALRDEQRIGGGREAAVLGDAFEGAQGVQRQPAPVDRLLLLHQVLRRGAAGAAILAQSAASRQGEPCFPMPFFDVGSEFLGFERRATVERSAGKGASPALMNDVPR